jgi:iron complex outermembrane receptor protein
LTDQLQIKNILGLASASSRDANDLDGSPYGVIEVKDADGNPTTSLKATRQFSEEFQLVGTALDRDLKYIVGAYYGYQRDTYLLPTEVVDLAPIIPATPNQTGAVLWDDTEALFTQGTYDLSSATHIQGLSFTAGVRYTFERNKIAQAPISHFYGNPDESQDTHKPSWQVGLEYQLTPNLLTYVETRGSFRSGGFNVVAPATFATAQGGGNEFLPETTHDVEVGSKFQGALLGIPTRLNIALYDQWVQHVQRAIYTNVPPNNAIASVTANVPSAQIRGVEAEATIVPSVWLELGGNLAFTNAAYTDGSVSLFGNQYEFGPYGDSPRWSGSLYGQVNLPVPQSLGRPSLRADVYAQSMQFFSNLASTVAPQTAVAGYGLINLRLDWHDFGVQGLTVSAFGRNVGDKRYSAGGIALGAGLGINGVIPGAPRMYGAEVTYKF